MRLALVLAATLMPLAAQTRTDALDRALRRVQDRVAAKDIWQDHTAWENAWRVETEHFAVRTTKSYGFAKQMATDLETMLGHFQTTLGVDRAPLSRIEVLIFPDIGAYNAFGNQFGQEHSSLFGAFLATEQPQKQVGAAPLENLTQMRMDITHAVLHRWLDDTFTNNAPTWVEEGLASYFSLFWDFDWGLRRFATLREQKQLMPLSRLLGDGITNYRVQTQDRVIQLAVLFSYLLAYREDTRTTTDEAGEVRAPFRDYLVKVLRGERVTGSPVHRLTRNVNDLQEEFWEFDFGN